MTVRPISPAMLNRIFNPHARGHHTIYREGEVNFCPGCGRTQWHIGRVSAECAFCSTAMPLEASLFKLDAALERPRLVRGAPSARHSDVRPDAVSHRRRAA
jgi:hypothetical protein